MPLVTLSQAAALAGKSKATLSRAVASGKLSAAKRSKGSVERTGGRGGARPEVLIDVAELERVYGPLQRPNVAPIVSEERGETPRNEELRLLRQRIAELEADRGNLRQQLEAEQSERGRLVAVIEDQARTMRLLEDHRTPTVKFRWWSRIMNK